MWTLLPKIRARWVGRRAKPRRERIDTWARFAALVAAAIALTALWPVWSRPDVDATDTTQRTVQRSTTRSRKGRPAVTKNSLRKEEVAADDSSVGEVIVNEAGVFVLVRLAAIATTAFLAGAVVQRILLAKFAVKVGPVELKEPELDPVEVKTTFEGVIDALQKQSGGLRSSDPSRR